MQRALRVVLGCLPVLATAAMLQGCGATPAYTGISREPPTFGSYLARGGTRRMPVGERSLQLTWHGPALELGFATTGEVLRLDAVSRAERIFVRRRGDDVLIDTGDGDTIRWSGRWVRARGRWLRLPDEPGTRTVALGLRDARRDGVLRRGGGVAVGRAWFHATPEGDLFVAVPRGRILLRGAVALGGMNWQIEDERVPSVTFVLADGQEARLVEDRVEIDGRALRAGEML